MRPSLSNPFYEVDRVRQALRGPVPSVSPCFLENDELDWDGIADNIEFLIASGAGTLLLTYGDSLLSILTDEENDALTRFVAERAGHRAMVVGCGRKWPLKQSLQFARHCRDCGADVVIPFAPDWAQHADPELLVEYYRAVGAVMPVMLLSNPMNGRGIPLSVMETLSAQDGIVAVKDDAPAPYGRRLGSVIRDTFAFLSGGTAENFLQTAPYGADGYLSVFMRAFPQVSHRFWEAWENGDTRECVRLIDTYEVSFFRFCAENHIHFSACIHGMTELAGVCSRRIRMPYSTMTDGQMELLRAYLAGLGLMQ